MIPIVTSIALYRSIYRREEDELREKIDKAKKETEQNNAPAKGWINAGRAINKYLEQRKIK